VIPRPVPGLSERDLRLGVDEPGVGADEGLGPDVVLLDPGQTAAGQGGNVGTDQRLQADVARLGQEHGTQADREIGHAGRPLADVSELAGEPGPSLDLQEGFGQVDAGKQGRDFLAESDQAGRLFQFVQAGQRDGLASVLGFQPDGGVGRQVGSGTAIGLVEAACESLNLGGRRRLAAKDAADVGSGGFPGRSLEQLDAWVSPTHARPNEHVATAEAVLEPLQHANGIGPAVDPSVRADHVTSPAPRDVIQRSAAHVGLVLALGVGQEVQGIYQWLASRGGLEGDGAEHVGPEPANAAVLLDLLGMVVVVGRPGQRPDEGDRLGEGWFGDPGKNGRAELGIATGIVEQDRARFAELQGGGIQIVNRAESFLSAGTSGLERQFGDQRIEHVEGVVQRSRLEDAGEGQQGGDSPVRRHPRDGCRPDRAGVPGQGVDPAGRDMTQVQATHVQRSDFHESIQGRHQSRAAHACGAIPEPVQRRLSAPLGDDHQRLQPRALFGAEGTGQGLPKSTRRAIADLGHQA
jgi:hypothetical protein